jgi:hypothetical protein
MRLLPKPCGDGEGINPHVMPPGDLVATGVELPVMIAAERHGVLVTDLGPECLGLGEADMMSVGRATTADETGLGGDVAKVLLVADPPGFAQDQYALVDPAAEGRAPDGAGAKGGLPPRRDSWD